MLGNYRVIIVAGVMFMISGLLLFGGGLGLRWFFLHGNFSGALRYIWSCRWIIILMAAGIALLYVPANVFNLRYFSYLPPAIMALVCVWLGRGIIPPLFTRS